MNILHVIPGDLWAGAESQMYSTVKELCRASQHEISVIVFCDGELYRKLQTLEVDVTLLDEKKNSSIAICLGIRKKILACDSAIVHVHEYKSHVLSVFAMWMTLRNRRVLFRTMHGLTAPRSLKSHLITLCEQFFLRFATDNILAVSADLEQELLQKPTRAKIVLIYNSVDLPAPLSKVDALRVRRSFDLEDDHFWIGTAARLEEVKNLQMLIEAANILKKDHAEMKFRISIFGEGSLRSALKSQIVRHNLEELVFLEGHNSNIIPVLQALDVFTLVSLHEGLPMSLLEAMSVGTIPVCTAVGGMKEAILHGEDGYLISPADTGQLAETFFNVCTERPNLNSVGARAREKVNNIFSIAKNGKELLFLYEQSCRKFVR